MIAFEQSDTLTAVEAKAAAQRIAFGPVLFQATLAMRRLGILDELYTHRLGRTVAEIAQSRALSEYGARVLLEAGLSAGIVALSGERFTLTKTGWFLLKDDPNLNGWQSGLITVRGAKKPAFAAFMKMAASAP